MDGRVRNATSSRHALAMMHEQPAAVLFDLDGVLLDSERLHLELTSWCLARQGIEHDPSDLLELVGRSDQDCDLWMTTRYADRLSLPTFLDEYWKEKPRRASEVPRKQGSDRALGRISQLLPVAVVTGSSRTEASSVLRSTRLDQFVSLLIAGDDVKRGKPDPEPFLTGAARLGVDPARCIAVEDSVVGARSARAAGMQVVVIPDLVEPSADELVLVDWLCPDLDSLADAVAGLCTVQTDD